MKKLCILLLLPVFLLNNTLGEAFKLPVLFAHFLEHRQQDPSVDLGDFISMHYGGDDHNPGDEDRDRQLPYKKICESGCYEIAPIPAKIPVVEKQLYCVRKTVLLSMRDSALSDPAPGSPFRPPCC